MKTVEEIIEAINNADWIKLGTKDAGAWLIDLFSEEKIVSSRAYNKLDTFLVERNESPENYALLSEIFEHRDAVIAVSFLLEILASDIEIGKENALLLLYDVAANISLHLREAGDSMENVLEVKRMLTHSKELFVSLTTHSKPEIQGVAKDTTQWLNTL
jgi:hypothetical protein